MALRNIFTEDAVLLDLPAAVYHTASAYGYDLGGTGKGAKVVVIDTGKPDHLAIPKAADAINLGDSHTVNDTVGQSTIVAGVIAARNPESVCGMAPDAEMYYAKINGDGGGVQLDAIVSAYLWAVIKGADVIVMPLTTDVYHEVFEETVAKAVSSNICVVCSSGSADSPQYPASFPGVLSVGATKQNRKSADFSKKGDVNVVGTSICSTYVKQNYCVASGAACATAIVGGLAALVASGMKALGKYDAVKAAQKIKAMYQEIEREREHQNHDNEG